jgi:DNA-binding NarL/FixJ family response regulator
VIRIVVADDHPVVREGLVAMLATEPDFEVVAQASSGAETISVVTTHDPDVLILDLAMPDFDGVEVLRRLSNSRTRTIVFTVFDTDERIIAAVEAGAAGYLLKGAPRADLFAAIRVVAAGGSLLTREANTGARLTPRERDVLEHLARGLGNKQIAAALGISERTVKFHVSAVFTKLGARTRTAALRRAAEAGLISL